MLSLFPFFIFYFFFIDKKRYLVIALKNCLDLGLGSDYRKETILRLLLMCIGEGVLVVVSSDKQMNSTREIFP